MPAKKIHRHKNCHYTSPIIPPLSSILPPPHYTAPLHGPIILTVDVAMDVAVAVVYSGTHLRTCCTCSTCRCIYVLCYMYFFLCQGCLSANYLAH